MATVNTTWVNPAGASLDKATGATIDETMTDGWSSGLYHLGGTAGYIGCRAYASASLSVANSTFTALGLNTESFDSDPNGAMHDTASNNSRITIRTAGVYHVSVYVSFDIGSTGYRQCYVRLNGSAILFGATLPGIASVVCDFCFSHPYLFAASDYVEILVAHTQGTALNVTTQVLSVVKA